MKKIIFVNFSAIFTILSMMLIVSCGGGGSSTSSGGGGTVSGATVLGDVSQFNGVAMVAPEADQSMLAHALESVSDRVLSTANALAGVTVTIGGVTTVTGSDGSFSIEGIPPGPTELVLTYNGVTATTIIDIPLNAEEVYLNDMQVVGENILIASISIEVEDNLSSDNKSSDDKSSDDKSSDEKISDDKSSDDDSSAAKTT